MEKVTSIKEARKAKMDKQAEDLEKKLADQFKKAEEQMEHIEKKHTEALKEPGWFAHYISTDLHTPHLVNCHTHGLPGNFDHPDLQIVLNIPPQTAQHIFTDCIKYIKEGRQFEDGEKFALKINFVCWFKQFREGGRDVLRVILPDPKRSFPGDEGCAEGYDLQLTQFAEE